MKSKYRLAAALLLPFATMSKAANVDQMCGHWQKATRQAEQRAPNAYPGPTVTDQHPTWDFKLCTYQGGPKINTCAGDARTELSGRTDSDCQRCSTRPFRGLGAHHMPAGLTSARASCMWRKRDRA